MVNVDTFSTPSLLALVALTLATACSSPNPVPPNPDFRRWFCQNDSDVNWYKNLAGGTEHPDPMEVCIHKDNGDAEARTACSSRCEGLSYAVESCEDGGCNCKDEGWTSTSNTNQACAPELYGWDIGVIQGELGLTAAQEVLDLPCDLNLSCADYLPISAREQLWLPPTSSAPTTADTPVQTLAPTTSSVKFKGAGQTSWTAKSFTGGAAYTAVDALDCGADACPFYLAQLDMTQTSGTWYVPFEVGGVTLLKELSNLTIGLARPTLGVWLPNSGDVIFPPHALTLTVDATVGGSTNTYGENGSYSDVEYINYGYVFGHVSGSSFTLDYARTDTLGDLTFDLEFEP